MTLIKPTIAFIDDDERILRAMQVLFRSTYNVFITTDPEEYINYIRFNLVHVAVSDQRMPLREGVDILREIKDISPYTMRILLTGYADLEAIIGSINEGEIFRYLTKPCKADEIKATVTQAVEIAQANFDHHRSTSTMPFPVENDHLNMIVGMVNGLEQPTTTQNQISQKTATSTLTPNSTPATQPTTPPKPLVVSTASQPVKPPQKLEKLLLMDDSLDVKAKVEQLVMGKYEVLHASTLEQAYELLAHNTVGVCITDIVVNEENIAPVIYTLKQNNPSLVVLVQTAFQDASALIDLINKGQVFRCLPKPIRGNMLEVGITRAFEYHQKLRENSTLAKRHVVEPVKAEEAVQNSKLKNLVGLFRQKFS